MNINMLLLLLNMLWGQQEAAISSSAGQDATLTVSYCDLIAHPEQYKDKIVRVKASYFTGRHAGFFYDLECDGLSKRAHSALSCGDEESCKNLRETIDKVLAGGITMSRAELTVIGRFKGPGAYGKISPNDKGLRFEL
jgi:hypothetical protein